MHHTAPGKQHTMLLSSIAYKYNHKSAVDVYKNGSASPFFTCKFNGYPAYNASTALHTAWKMIHATRFMQCILAVVAHSPAICTVQCPVTIFQFSYTALRSFPRHQACSSQLLFNLMHI